MTGSKRVFALIGAPLVLMAGIAAIVGVQNAKAVKHRIEAWADSLDHSASPVVLDVPFAPMYIDGDRIGRLRRVVVQREAPGAIDSLAVAIDLRDGVLRQLQDCAFRLDPDAVDRHGPAGLAQLVHCINDTTGLVRFGSVTMDDEFTSGLYLEPHDMPCGNLERAECAALRTRLDRLRDEIRDEIRIEVRNARDEVQRAREEMQRAREEIRQQVQP